MTTKTTSPLERVDFRLGRDAVERLRELAREDESNVGVILRRAVRRYLEAERHGTERAP